jgi:hypothetical protein
MDSAGGYIVNFASILFGLALGDLLLNLDRLLRNWREIRWHPLPLIAAAFVTLALLAGWWDLYDVLTSRSTFTILDFLPDFIKLILLFLIAAAALPSSSSSSVDLKEFYFANRKYFYTLWMVTLAWILMTPIMRGNAMTAWGLAFLLPRLVIVGVLAWTNRVWIHYVGLALLISTLAYVWLGVAIGAPPV